MFVTSGSARIVDSRTVINGLAASGALFTFFAKVNLANVTFSNNLNANGIARDLDIRDDIDPTRDGSFVACDSTFKVNFCDGDEAIDEVGTVFKNTNCRENGIANASLSGCTA
jgi:hypothetical protein